MTIPNGVATPLPEVQPISRATLKLSKTISDLDASKVIITQAANLKPLPETDDLLFGKNSTDHMLIINFTPGVGWSAPEIKPYGPLSLDPACSCFHYCTNIFEGMKAYLGPDGEPRLFRPQMNMSRMQKSAERVALPPFNGEELLKLIKQLVLLDKRWIPTANGCSLYIRPTMIGTRPSLGVAASDHACLYVLLSPTGPYFKTGSTAVRLFAFGDSVRTWPGGTGGFKLGSNYTSSFQPQAEAAKRGYQQILWLLNDGKCKPEDMLVTEAGSMNFFVVVKRDDGDLDAVTPPLDGTILAGLTRDSVLDLIASHTEATPLGDLPPTRRIYSREIPYTIGDLYKWSSEDRLLEAFGVGTAVVVSSIGVIGFDGKPDIQLPEHIGMMGPVAKALHHRLVAIQEGRSAYKGWSVACSS